MRNVPTIDEAMKNLTEETSFSIYCVWYLAQDNCKFDEIEVRSQMVLLHTIPMCICGAFFGGNHQIVKTLMSSVEILLQSSSKQFHSTKIISI